jgi:ABC-type polar amino acid transport system ATPase subunit
MTPHQEKTGPALGPLAVEVQALYKSFGNTQVLNGISLSVMTGGVAAVIGPSGGGKSTLLRCINYLEEPDSGHIMLKGQPFGAWINESGRRIRQPGSALRRDRARMPMVFQRFNLFQHLTVLDNVVVGQRLALKRSRAEAEDKAKAVLDRVGLASKLKSYPATLSGGQQQRVGIARALAMDPDVILLDEPTSSLDPELTGEVLQIIKDLAVAGMTMIIATHELGLARLIASRVHFIDGGVIAEEGTPREVFDQPKGDRTRDFVRSVIRWE